MFGTFNISTPLLIDVESLPVLSLSSLDGKNAICFGDSITWYDGHIYNWGKEEGKTACGFESYLRKEGMIVQNEGISNATICDIYQHIMITDFKRFEYVFLTSGANDSRFNIPTGQIMPRDSAFDPATFAGCLQSSIEHIRKNNSVAKIVLMTPLNGWIYAPDGYEYQRVENGRVENRFADVILQVGDMYGCSVCDWFYKIEMNESTRVVMINDPEPDFQSFRNPNTLYSLHPSTEGYRIMSELLMDTLKTV